MQLAYVSLGTINHIFSGSDKASVLEKPGHLLMPFAIIYQSALAMSHYRQLNTHLRSEVFKQGAWYESSIKMSIYSCTTTLECLLLLGSNMMGMEPETRRG